jgi:hypothetical protein
MAYILGVPVAPDSEDVLMVEVDRREVVSGLVLASPDPAHFADRSRASLEEALAKLRPSLERVVHLFRELSPDECEVEFGLKIGGETGIIIARGTAEVNFIVRMNWKSQQPGSSKPRADACVQSDHLIQCGLPEDE